MFQKIQKQNNGHFQSKKLEENNYFNFFNTTRGSIPSVCQITNADLGQVG